MASVVTIAVHVASHVSSGLHSIAGAFQSILGAIPGMIGSVFSQTGSALSGGIGNALKEAGSNPYVLAGITALVASIAPVLGTLLGGALVLALGGALVGVGAIFAAKAKSVKAAWSKTFEDIKKGMADVAKPLEPVLKHAAALVGDLFKKMKPFLEIFYKTVSPSISLLFDSLAESFAKFGPILPTLGKAFSQLITQLSPVFAENISSLASALNGLFKEFSKKETAHAFAQIIGVLIGIIPLFVRILRGLTVTFMVQWDAIKGEIGLIKSLIGWIRRLTGKTIKIGQTGASSVINWVKTAIGWIKNLKGKTVSILQRGAGGVISAVSTAISTVRRFVGKTISIGVRGAGAAVSAVRNVINWVRRLAGKTIRIGVNLVTSGAKSLLSKINPFARGGIIGAAGGGPRSNLVMVGENGPEIARLPFGTTVRSNPDTRRMLGSQRGVQPFSVILNVGDRKFAELLIDPLRKTVQSKGGVRAALGPL